jgi:C-terminal processing protease CtpA/Prc
MGGLGLGLGVNMRDDQWAGIRVTELMPGSPAAEIGVIEIGDELLEIDNERIDDHNFEGYALLFCLCFFTGASSRDTRHQKTKTSLLFN